jgi:cell fate (sporulation/competence/biofilm development) regulator YmcA (YheA/YmcA/DUF963 family)
MADYQRFATDLIRKEQQGRPIEVAEKHKLEQLQTAVVTNPVLRSFQMAQMDLVDLLRKFDEQITGEAGVDEGPEPAAGPGGPGGPGAGASPLVYP